LVVWTPFHETNPLAFSQRGTIWMASLSTWHRHLWLGSGPDYYHQTTPWDHGHNLVVDSLARGGLLALAAITIWLAVLIRQSFRMASLSAFPLLLMIAIVYTSWLEVPVEFGNLSNIGYACWFPLAVICFTRDERALGAGLQSAATAIAGFRRERSVTTAERRDSA